MSETLRVLIVEDVPTDAELMEYELQNAGITVSAQRVETKEAFIAALSTFLPHVILSDYALPSFDGITAMQLALERAPDTPFIFVTGALGEELAIDLLKQGATDYVLKSRLSRLPVAVNRALREVEERKERERTQAELKRAENELLGHLRFFQKVDIINRAMQGTNDLDRIIGDVLDAMLSIFDCDRVWLVCPWDPASAYESVIERTRPEYQDLGVIPMSPDIVTYIQAIASSDGAVTLGPGCDHPLSKEVLRYGLKSVIGIALHPKTGKPWGIGMHQCSYPRVWTPDERKLLEEIARRMSDVLTSLLVFRSLRESEQALRQSDAYLAEAQRLSHTGSWAFDVAGNKYVYLSDECFRIFEFDAQQGLPTREAVSRLIHPEDWESVNGSYEKSLREKVDTLSEFRITLPSGTVKHVHTIRHPVLNEAGDVVRIVGTVIDITERKQAEEELHRARAELARVERASRLGELVASLAHELNQPLAAILSSAQAALRFLKSTTPDLDLLSEILRHIVEDDERAAGVIKGLRSMVRKEEGLQERLSVNDVLRDILTMFRGEAIIRLVEINTEFDDPLPPVRGDRIQLQQVVLNLIMNAAEAMADNPRDRRKIILRTQAIDHMVRVTVKDFGPGIDPARLQDIWQPYFTTKQTGLGMGLSVTSSIIKAHRGRIWAENNPHAGATFAFEIPIDESATGGQEP